MAIDSLEKRRAPRHTVNAPATVRKASGEKAAATIVNISTSGMLLELAQTLDLAVGDKVMVEIESPPDPDKPLPVWGLARVVRTQGARVAVEIFTAGFHPLQGEPPWHEEP